tara:strand:+ start:166 stop:618 length:453 start_codon:yes stop_codon:yes gene_type:complete
MPISKEEVQTAVDVLTYSGIATKSVKEIKDALDELVEERNNQCCDLIENQMMDAKMIHAMAVARFGFYFGMYNHKLTDAFAGFSFVFDCKEDCDIVHNFLEQLEVIVDLPKEGFLSIEDFKKLTELEESERAVAQAKCKRAWGVTFKERF